MSAAPIITSLQNERIKAIRALEQRKVRDETGLFVAEGVANLASARSAGWVPATLVHRAGDLDETESGLVGWAAAGGAEMLAVNGAVMEKLTGRSNPPRLAGVFPRRFVPLPQIAAIGPNALWLALEAIHDPGNLGTIIRTADAAGATGIILIGPCVDPTGPAAVQAAMGSVFQTPIVRSDAGAFSTWLAGWPGDVAGTHLSGSKDIRQLQPRWPVLVIMGSEGAGLSAELTERCAQLVRIPQRPGVDSLNLAVATGLMLYALRLGPGGDAEALLR